MFQDYKIVNSVCTMHPTKTSTFFWLKYNQASKHYHLFQLLFVFSKNIAKIIKLPEEYKYSDTDKISLNIIII